MSNIKVLIVTYYWPPYTGGGVHRWLKFSKYLSMLDVQPVIYTPSNPDYGLLDESLTEKISPSVRVIKHPIREPYKFYKALLPKSKRDKVNQPSQITGYKKGLLNRIVMYIRSNMFIPDPRIWWVRPSIRFLDHVIRQEKIDCVITTGPPHSMHLIGLGLKNRSGIKWIADFRDPWSRIDFIQELTLTQKAYRKHQMLEKEVIENADARVTVSPSLAASFEELHGPEFNVITNGYDPDDYQGLKPGEEDGLFRITYVGSLNKSRNPHHLWKLIGEKYHADQKLRIRVKLIGSIDPSVFDDIRRAGITDLVEHNEQIPHQQGLQEMKSSDLLLLLINETPGNEGILPGKMFEYIAVGKPILCIGNPDGDCARVIRSGRFGYAVSGDDLAAMNSVIDQAIEGTLPRSPEQTADSEFSVRSLAMKYRDLIEEVIHGPS